MYFPWNVVVTAVAFGEDGTANGVDCNSSWTFDIELWTAATANATEFALYKEVLANQFTSRVADHTLNVPVAGKTWYALGIENNCAGSLDDYNIKLEYYRTPVDYS